MKSQRPIGFWVEGFTMDKFKIYLVVIYALLWAGLYSIATAFYKPEMQMVAIVSGFGFAALAFLAFVLALPLIVGKFRGDFTINLLKNRRSLGVFTFILALTHVSLVMNFFAAWNFLEIFGKFELILGFAAFLILLSMALTSTDWAVRKLGRNWKRLHSLVYIAIILIVIHSSLIGVIIMTNQIVKFSVIAIVGILIAVKWWPRKN